MPLVFFTVIARNYAHFARTLGASLAEHHAGVERVLVLVDVESHAVEPFEFPQYDRILTIDQLALPDRQAFCFRYDALELSTAVKPYVFEALLEAGHDRVIYLDPDIWVLRPLTEVLSLLETGASAVLTPHSLVPRPQSQPPNDTTFLQAGAYNLGFLAVSDTPQTRTALAWWKDKLEFGCLSNRTNEGIFVDQKYMDLWPAYCPGTAILHDPTYNVAYWNIDDRVPDDRALPLRLDGRPIAFYHFSGIVPGDRERVSRHRPELKTTDYHGLGVLFEAYHQALERNGLAAAASVPYGFGRFSDGTPIPKIARVAFRDLLEPFSGNPFADGLAALNAPVAGVIDPPRAITTIMYALWRSRPDLQQTFDLHQLESQLLYCDWFCSTAGTEEALPDVFLLPARHALQTRRVQTSAARLTGLKRRMARLTYSVLMRLRPSIRFLYRRISPELRQRLVNRLAGAAWSTGRTSNTAASLAPGITLIGYAHAEMGVGEAMRRLAGSVSAAGIPFEVVNIALPADRRQQDHTLAPHVVEAPGRALNVFCVNADMVSSTISTLGASTMSGRYNVLRPFWELPHLHHSWLEPLRQFDEVWAPTRFVQQAFSASGFGKVVHVPVSIDVPIDMAPARDHFGIPANATAYLFAFDFSSFPARKNPEAVLDAWAAAFGGDARADVALVIKTMGQGPGRLDVLSRLRSLAERDPRIIIIDAVLSREDMYRLTASTDVFVSLHRSEGFGLGIAEAMAMGKVAIATDFSGSADFVTRETGFPVPYRLAEVQPEDYPYFIPGQHWAEPDIESAARAMRNLAGQRELLATMGARARRFMQERHSPAVVGKIIAAHLRESGQLR